MVPFSPSLKTGTENCLQYSTTRSGDMLLTKQNAHSTALCLLRRLQVQYRHIISRSHSEAVPARSCSVSYVLHVFQAISAASDIIFSLRVCMRVCACLCDHSLSRSLACLLAYIGEKHLRLSNKL